MAGKPSLRIVIVNYLLHFVQLYELLFISVCLCIIVRYRINSIHAIVFNYVREF